MLASVRRPSTSSVAVLLGAIAAAAVAAAPAPAATPQAVFALRPVDFTVGIPATKSYFVVPARPGDVVASRVRVTNVGGAAGDALLYPSTRRPARRAARSTSRGSRLAATSAPGCI